MLELKRMADSRTVDVLMPPTLLWRERVIGGVLALCASIPIVGIGMIFIVFVYQTTLFFQEVPFYRFLIDTQWTPLFLTQRFGIGVLISATMMITAIALLVAIPLGTLAAIYLSEYAPQAVRQTLKPILEALAGVPTVVYGYFALQFITPNLKSIIPGISGFNALSAGLVTGALVLPIISSLSEDAIRNVPDELREGAYASGLTRFEAIAHVVLPSALPGIIASYTLATSRAMGETMIAAIAAGQNPSLTLNPLVPIESMTSFIVQVSLGDVPADSLAFHTIFAVGLVLFLITLTLNHAGQVMVRRYSSIMSSLFVPTAEAASMAHDRGRGIDSDPSSSSPYPLRAEGWGERVREFFQPLRNGVRGDRFDARHRLRIWVNQNIAVLGLLASFIGVVVFLLLLFGTFQDGLLRLNWQFLVSAPSRNAAKAGILPALVGTFWLMVLPAILIIPIGVGAAIYLEEYMPKGRLSRFIELNIANAVAVPSVLYGIMGLALFVRYFSPLTGGRSLMSASLVMAMIALPLFITAVQMAFRSIPDDLRQAAYAVGMTRSQMVATIALPHALPRILTGLLLALSRIMGETAALLAIGALAFVNFLPPVSIDGLYSPFTTLPTQIFFWALRPQHDFQINAAAAIIVLGILVLVVNISAVLLRDFYRHRY